MAHNPSQSVADLRRESERTRAELSQTVEALKTKVTDTAADLRDKVSPEHIKAEVSDYVTQKSRHWFDSLKQQAMDNPMQALTIGTAIAVPAFKAVRSVPVPLLMIGAGLALASPKVRDAATEKISAGLKTADGRNIMDEARDKARETTAGTRDAAAQLADDARKRVGEFGDAARDTLGSARETLTSTMSSAGDAAREALDTTRTRATETVKTMRVSAENVVRDNAALMGGLGLAIGALLAASLPSTRVERGALGPASDALRKGAADTASEKFEDLKHAAMSATERAAERISEAGIGSRMSEAADEATEGLKTVADDAVTTAFEPSETEHR